MLRFVRGEQKSNLSSSYVIAYKYYNRLSLKNVKIEKKEKGRFSANAEKRPYASPFTHHYSLLTP